MSCSPSVQTYTFAIREVVFSKGGTAPATSDVFVLSPEKVEAIAPLIDKVRATTRVENITADCEVQPVYQVSDDGENWDTAVPFAAGFIGSNGYSTSDWATVANTKRAIRFGVLVQQKTGSTVESARVSLMIDVYLLK